MICRLHIQRMIYKQLDVVGPLELWCVTWLLLN